MQTNFTTEHIIKSFAPAFFMLAFCFMPSSAYAQEADSTRCADCIGLYTKHLGEGRPDQAYIPWATAFREAPPARKETYEDGVRILHALMAGTKDEALQKKYFAELMAVYDKEIENIDTLNAVSSDSVSKGRVLGEKAHDYILFAGAEMDADKAYGMVKEAVGLEQEASEPSVLEDLANLSLRKLKADESHKEQFIADYLAASGYVSEALRRATGEDEKRRLKIAKDNIDSRFVSSGTAGCENLQNVYAPQIEAHRQDVAYLKGVIAVMKRLKCTNEDVYYAACEAAHAIEPDASTALGCAYLHYRQGGIDESIRFFDESVELEEDTLKKADNCYSAAVALYSKKMLGKARQYAEKAISYNGKYGQAYLLIAQMYASSPNWSHDATLNKCTYYAAIDKLQLAKSADPGVAEEAQKLITAYASQTPKEEDLFFLGLKKGSSVTIGGWINEKTTVR